MENVNSPLMNVKLSFEREQKRRKALQFGNEYLTSFNDRCTVFIQNNNKKILKANLSTCTIFKE